MKKKAAKSLAIRKPRVNKPEMVPLARTSLTGSGRENRLLPQEKQTSFTNRQPLLNKVLGKQNSTTTINTISSIASANQKNVGLHQQVLNN